LFRGWDGDGEVGVFGEACDEEHEAASLDLHFCKVCAAGGDASVFSVGLKLVRLIDDMLGWNVNVRHALLVRLQDA
jgi:hypothetical protein